MEDTEIIDRIDNKIDPIYDKLDKIDKQLNDKILDHESRIGSLEGKTKVLLPVITAITGIASLIIGHLLI